MQTMTAIRRKLRFRPTTLAMTLLVTIVLALGATVGYAGAKSVVWDVPSDYSGWARTARVPACATTTASCRDNSAPVYQWTGSDWRAFALQGDVQVWVQPYTGGWSWAWTQQTGWVAIHTADLDY